MKEWILGIDTSSIELGIGLLLDGKPVAAFSRYLRNSHAEHITEGISFILNNNRIRPEDIVAAGVTVGPGSFTGLRIGISFIKGLFLTRAVELYAISSLEAIAMAWNTRESTITAALDARNDRVFSARFHKTDKIVERLTEDTLMHTQDFRAGIEQSDTVLTDTLGYGRSSAFSFLKGCRNSFELEHFPVQRGLAAARCARQSRDEGNSPVALEQLLPRYLQQSAAELRHKPQPRQ